MTMEQNKTKTTGHLLALFSILVWGTTFVATKTLLRYYDALQIMLIRFFIAWAALWVLTRKPVRIKSLRDELGIFAMSLSGVTLYYYFENTALSYTLASNVSIILASAPIFTALLAHVFTRDEKLTCQTWAGFAIAFAGVVLVVFNGTYVLKLNPLGDFLSLATSLSWAVYSILLKKYVDGYDNMILTRKIAFYGLVLTAPAAFLTAGVPETAPLSRPEVVFCLLFLGLLGSAICYVTWNYSVKSIGVVATNDYIYLNPFVTMVSAALVLGEKISMAGVVGAVLIIGGIVVSQKKEGQPMLETFYPAEYVDSVYGLDFEDLYKKGYRGILFDIDNTLVPHGEPADARSMALFEKLHEMGFATCLISNNKKKRVEPFAEDLHTPFIFMANKPSRRGYTKGMELIGTELSNTVFVGDQLFTDVWGASRMGMYSILTKPINPKEEIQIVLKRYLEKPVLKSFEKKRAGEEKK